MTADSDEALYVAWRGGDPQAGNELAERHCPALLRFFAHKVPEAADDLLQKTFLACIGVETPAQEVRSFRSLLFGIARKQLLRHFEGRGQLRGEEMMSRVSLADLGTSPTGRIAAREQKMLVQQALGMLPMDQQIALELYYWQKLSIAEVASVFGLSPGGTRNKLFRARQTLRETYAKLTRDPLLGFTEDPE